jgi:hypothetical protein
MQVSLSDMALRRQPEGAGIQVSKTYEIGIIRPSSSEGVGVGDAINMGASSARRGTGGIIEGGYSSSAWRSPRVSSLGSLWTSGDSNTARP